MPSAYLQWRFHSGERVVARGPLVIIWSLLGSGVGGDGEFFSNGHAVSTKMVAMPIYSKMLKKFFPEPRKLRG